MLCPMGAALRRVPLRQVARCRSFVRPHRRRAISWQVAAQVNDRMLGAILRDFLVVLEEHAQRSGAVVHASSADITTM